MDKYRKLTFGVTEMNERIEAYDGANQEGQWVFDSQGVASDEGFGHVSKDWYPKTISYDEGMDQLEAEQGHRQDYLARLPIWISGSSIWMVAPSLSSLLTIRTLFLTTMPCSK